MGGDAKPPFELKGWQKHFNSYTVKGRMNVRQIVSLTSWFNQTEFASFLDCLPVRRPCRTYYIQSDTASKESITSGDKIILAIYFHCLDLCINKLGSKDLRICIEIWLVNQLFHARVPHISESDIDEIDVQIHCRDMD